MIYIHLYLYTKISTQVTLTHTHTYTYIHTHTHKPNSICSYSNGQRYEGMWRGGLKDGRGRLVFSDGGAQYEGRFREDQLDGQGTLELLQPLPGTNKGDWVIPLDVNVDVARAHTKAGFTQGGK